MGVGIRMGMGVGVGMKSLFRFSQLFISTILNLIDAEVLIKIKKKKVTSHLLSDAQNIMSYENASLQSNCELVHSGLGLHARIGDITGIKTQVK